MANAMKNKGMLGKSQPAPNEKMTKGKMSTPNKGKIAKPKMAKGKC